MRDILLMGGGAVLAAFAFGLVPESGVVPVRQPVALLRVEALDFDAGILSGARPTRTTSEQPGHAVVRWDFTPEMTPGSSADCAATLDARGNDRTKVAVDCRFAGGDGRPSLDARWAELLRLQMQENVDAAIAMRDFDHGRAGADITNFMARNGGGIARETGIAK
jgi:hypothetical protein